MKTINHKQAQKQLDALFVGDPCTAPLALRDHLRRCAECRRVFEQMAALDRALHGQDPESGDAGEFERRYTEAVMQATITSPEVVGADAAPRPWWRALLNGWRPAAALAVAATLAAVWLPGAIQPVEERGHGAAALDADERHVEESFSPRIGAGALATPRRQPRAGVHHADIFCARRVAQRTVFHSAQEGVLHCAQDAELKFAFVNEAQGDSAPLPYLALFGRHEDGQLLWYHPALPKAPGDASTRVGQAARLKPLGETIRLSVNHTPGRVQLFAVFSAMPLSRAVIEARVSDADDLNLDGASVTDERGQRAVLGSGRLGEYVVTRRVLQVQPSEGRARGGAE